MGLGQYGSLGEYCGPHTASSVFLMLLDMNGMSSEWETLIIICSIFDLTGSESQRRDPQIPLSVEVSAHHLKVQVVYIRRINKVV